METTMHILESISIIFASLVAIRGISAWRHEFIGKRRIELAEKVLGAFFAVKDAIDYIRSPVLYPGEGSTRNKQENENQKETESNNRAYIVYERYDKRRDIFNRFAVLKYRFMASFGKDKEDIFNDITKYTGSIFNASDALRTYWQHEDDEKNRKYRDECESIIYKRSGDDPLQKNIEGVQAKLEAATSSCFKETTCWKIFL